jgi:hypothetical protein
VDIAAERPADGQDAISEEALARAEQRRTWTLVGIGAAIVGGLALICLVLLTYAVYRWRQSRLV